MRTHVRLHTGLKPFACEACGRSFADKSNCNKHVRRCLASKNNKTVLQMPVNMDVPVDYQSQSTYSLRGYADAIGTSNSTYNPALNLSRPKSILLQDEDVNDFNVVEEDIEEYECSVCSASFSTVQAANAHMRVHKSRKASNAESTASDSGFSSKGNTTDSTSPIVIPSPLNRPAFENILESQAETVSIDEPPAKRHRVKVPKVRCLSDSYVQQNGSEAVCTVCNYRSSYPHVLAHARTHTGEKPFVCDVCNRAYADPSNYIKHRKRHMEGSPVALPRRKASQTPNVGETSSPIVLDSSSGSDEESHNEVLTVKAKPFECSLCSDSFDNPAMLTEHIRNHMEERNKQERSQSQTQEKPHQQRSADASSTQHSWFGNLVEREFRQENLQSPPGPHQNLHSQYLENPQRFLRRGSSNSHDGDISHVTDQSPGGRSGLLQYGSDHEHYPAGISSSPVVLDDMDSSDTIHDTDAMTEAYSQVDSSQIAEQFDDDFDPTAVSQEIRDSLIEFDAAKSLYKCIKCTYHNSVLYNLRKHIRTHTGEKPFKCDFCPRRFADKSNQRKHERKHHAAGDSPCEVSKEKPPPSTPLVIPTAPVIEPKQFYCDVCNVAFRYEGTLKKHRELHADSMMFLCSHCNGKFANLVELRRHQSEAHPHKRGVRAEGHDSLPELGKNTRGEQGFKCTKCGIMFALSVDLQRHYKKDHKDPDLGIQPPDDQQSGPNTTTSNYSVQPEKQSLEDPTYSNVQASSQDTDGAGVIDLTATDERVNTPKDAFQCTIEQLDTGMYRCILCGHHNSQLVNIFHHQKTGHSRSELVSFENMVNGGEISLVVNLGEVGYRCKICPFKSFFVSKVHHHIKQYHFVKINYPDAEQEEDLVDRALIMKKNPMSFYFECLFCQARHKAPKMLAKHVKNKHPQLYVKAQRQSKLSGNTNSSGEQNKVPSAAIGAPNGEVEHSPIPKHMATKRRRSSSSSYFGENQISDNGQSQRLISSLPYRCALCSHMFEEPGDLQVHFGDHCPGQVYPFTAALQNQVSGQGISQLFPCHMCGATYIQAENLQRHLENHAKNIIPVTARPTNSILEESHMQQMMMRQNLHQALPNGVMPHSLVAGGALHCPVCHAVFSDPQQLIVHVETHQRAGMQAVGNVHQQPFSPNGLLPQMAPFDSRQMPLMIQPQFPNPYAVPKMEHPQIDIFPHAHKGIKIEGAAPTNPLVSANLSMKLPVMVEHLTKNYMSGTTAGIRLKRPISPNALTSANKRERSSTYSQFEIHGNKGVEPISIYPRSDMDMHEIESQVMENSKVPHGDIHPKKGAHVLSEKSTASEDGGQPSLNRAGPLERKLEDHQKSIPEDQLRLKDLKLENTKAVTVNQNKELQLGISSIVSGKEEVARVSGEDLYQGPEIVSGQNIQCMNLVDKNSYHQEPVRENVTEKMPNREEIERNGSDVDGNGSQSHSNGKINKSESPAEQVGDDPLLSVRQDIPEGQRLLKDSNTELECKEGAKDSPCDVHSSDVTQQTLSDAAKAAMNLLEKCGVDLHHKTQLQEDSVIQGLCPKDSEPIEEESAISIDRTVSHSESDAECVPSNQAEITETNLEVKKAASHCDGKTNSIDPDEHCTVGHQMISEKDHGSSGIVGNLNDSNTSQIFEDVLFDDAKVPIEKDKMPDMTKTNSVDKASPTHREESSAEGTVGDQVFSEKDHSSGGTVGNLNESSTSQIFEERLFDDAKLPNEKDKMPDETETNSADKASSSHREESSTEGTVGDQVFSEKDHSSGGTVGNLNESITSQIFEDRLFDDAKLPNEEDKMPDETETNSADKASSSHREESSKEGKESYGNCNDYQENLVTCDDSSAVQVPCTVNESLNDETENNCSEKLVTPELSNTGAAIMNDMQIQDDQKSESKCTDLAKPEDIPSHCQLVADTRDGCETSSTSPSANMGSSSEAKGPTAIPSEVSGVDKSDENSDFGNRKPTEICCGKDDIVESEFEKSEDIETCQKLEDSGIIPDKETSEQIPHLGTKAEIEFSCAQDPAINDDTLHSSIRETQESKAVSEPPNGGQFSDDAEQSFSDFDHFDFDDESYGSDLDESLLDDSHTEVPHQTAVRNLEQITKPEESNDQGKVNGSDYPSTRYKEDKVSSPVDILKESPEDPFLPPDSVGNQAVDISIDKNKRLLECVSDKTEDVIKYDLGPQDQKEESKQSESSDSALDTKQNSAIRNEFLVESCNKHTDHEGSQNLLQISDGKDDPSSNLIHTESSGQDACRTEENSSEVSNIIEEKEVCKDHTSGSLTAESVDPKNISPNDPPVNNCHNSSRLEETSPDLKESKQKQLGNAQESLQSEGTENTEKIADETEPFDKGIKQLDSVMSGDQKISKNSENLISEKAPESISMEEIVSEVEEQLTTSISPTEDEPNPCFAQSAIFVEAENPCDTSAQEGQSVGNSGKELVQGASKIDEPNSGPAFVSGSPKLLPPIIVCSLCGAESQNKASYLQHLLTHTKVNCPVCDCIFQDVNKLYKHFYEVH